MRNRGLLNSVIFHQKPSTLPSKIKLKGTFMTFKKGKNLQKWIFLFIILEISIKNSFQTFFLADWTFWLDQKRQWVTLLPLFSAAFHFKNPSTKGFNHSLIAHVLHLQPQKLQLLDYQGKISVIKHLQMQNCCLTGWSVSERSIVVQLLALSARLLGFVLDFVRFFPQSKDTRSGLISTTRFRPTALIGGAANKRVSPQCLHCEDGHQWDVSKVTSSFCDRFCSHSGSCSRPITTQMSSMSSRGGVFTSSCWCCYLSDQSFSCVVKQHELLLVYCSRPCEAQDTNTAVSLLQAAPASLSELNYWQLLVPFVSLSLHNVNPSVCLDGALMWPGKMIVIGLDATTHFWNWLIQFLLLINAIGLVL